jgi:predicted acyl esterase
MAWPVPGTRWTELHLDTGRERLASERPAEERPASFAAMGDGLTFWTEPFSEPMELTGPASARLTVSSTTTEADLFLALRVQDPDGRDVTFPSAMDPHGGVGFGWLRSSLRKTDPERSLPYRPWYPFDERWPLEPGVPVDVDVEIWPFSVIVPTGYRFGLSLLGRDFEFPGDGPWPSAYGVSMRGNGIFVHTDEADRGGPEFRGTTTLHAGRLLLPFLDPVD